jgi:hypothetical protein
MHQESARLGAELEHHRLRHREARLRLVVRRLEDRVDDKRRHGHLVPLALRASLDDFRNELGRIQSIRTA